MTRTGKNKRIGVIGCGHWGKNYLRIFSSLPGAALTAIAEVDEAKLAGAGKSHPGAALFKTDIALIRSGLCDAVVVSTPASAHFKTIKAALNAGLDVLAEKPLTVSVAESAALARLAKARRRILMVAHTFLFNPGVNYVKKCIKNGILGKIYYMKAQRTHLGLIREDVNAVWDLAPHDISIFMYLLGEKPDDVQAMGRRVLRPDRDDAAFINLRFPSGVIANIHVSWADSNKERHLDVVGSKARIIFDDLNMQEPVRIFFKGVSVETGREDSFGDFKYLYRDGEIVSPRIQMHEPLKCLCEEFVRSLRTRKPNFSDGNFGRDVVDVLQRINKAMRAA